MAAAKPPLRHDLLERQAVLGRHAVLDRDDVLTFLGRDWGAARRAKDSWWLEQVSARGPEVGLAASESVSRSRANGSAEDVSSLRDLLRFLHLIDAANAALRR